MLRVALTGGIGTGKSVVLEQLRALGARVLDADAVAHAVMAPGTPAAAAIRDRFGAAVVAPDGGVDRPALGAVVFSDEGARRDLESIVHPAVYDTIDAWMAACAREGAGVAVAEIPLLFETGHEADFDVVLVTACAPDEQVRRIVARGGTEADARRRMAAQWPLSDKEARADHVIRTDGSLAETRARAAEVWRRLRSVRY
jgi:dephospho-CoA kinase